MRGLALVSVLAAASASRPAQACSTDSIGPGLQVEDLWGSALQTVPGGVVSLPALAVQIDPEEVARRTSMVLSGPDGEVETTLEVIETSAGSYLRFAVWDLILVFRPAVPLAAGATYQAHVTHPDSFFPESDVEQDFPVVVGDAAAPLTAPRIEVSGDVVAIEYRDLVCCEREIDSCGDSTECWPQGHVIRPALEVEAALDDPSLARNAEVWIAPVLPGGALGPRRPVYVRSLGLRQDLVFESAQPEYCAVAGARSFLDGSEVVSAPACVSQAEVGVPEEVALELPPDLGAFCVGPLLREDGTPYGAEAGGEATGGCQVPRAPSYGGLWLLLLLAPRRRAGRR